MALAVFLDLLSKYWHFCAISILVLVIGFYKLSGDKAEAKLQAAIAEHSSIVSQFNTLKISTKACNEKVDELSKRGIELQTRVEEASKTIATLELKNRDIIREIKTGIVPKDCSQAINYMINNVKKNTKDWEAGK
ncbi:MAG: hypothetical protein HQK52_19600 [Oligoflexia bacterium]|nr:hypothetical protein [Oligoflexia bacterium]